MLKGIAFFVILQCLSALKAKTNSMNRQRRSVLHAVLDGLARLRDPVDKAEALKILQKAQSDVQKCADEEEEALDNRPESFQWSAANDAMTDNVSDLTDASGDLEVLIENCQSADKFSYQSVKSDVIKIVNTIKQTIHR